jgi:DNA (cytosine-5)-methyltransferase 1
VIASRLSSRPSLPSVEQVTPLDPAIVRLENDGDEFHLFHRRVRYGASTRKWRAALVRRILADRTALPGASAIRNATDARAIVDEVTTSTAILTHALHELYGSPDLGNVKDPVSELIYVVLCWRTRIPTARAMLDELRSTFPTWEDMVRPESRRRLEEILRPGGFLTNKATMLLRIVSKLIADFGAADLTPLHDRSDADILAYLTSLPGIDLKGAQCVMLYSLGRRVLPVDAHTITVLSRLGTLSPLVGDLTGVEHRIIQRRIREAVAPRLRGPLHVNLVMHGREVCKRRSPECGRCEIRKFCAQWRRQEQAVPVRRSRPVLVDLFSGAGGLSTGFLLQGYRVALAVDSDRSACRTFVLNHPGVPAEKVVCADVDTLTRKNGELRRLVGRGVKVDVLAAGLPCQGFSKVGYRTKPHIVSRPTLTNDPRNRLFKALLRAVAQLTPDAVLVENVPDMRSAGEGKTNILQRLERGLIRLGYSVQCFGLNAARLGLPQIRHRLFVVAMRGSSSTPDAREWLLQQHGIKRPPSLTSSMEGLPRLRAGEGAMLQAIDSGGGKKRLLFHHEARAHNPLDLKLFSLLKPGDDSLVALERGGKTLMRYSTDNFHDKYFRLEPNGPCRTIVSHLHKDANGFIHPHDDRGITAREAARVQGFTDAYIFLGSRCDQFIQIGNAVPPLVGRCFAEFFEYAQKLRLE